MAMHPGRSRRAGERYPGGEIKPRDEGDVRAPTLWRRIKDDAVKGGAHPYAGTVLGRLSIFGLLADAEVAAGFRVAEIVGRYERLSGAPRRTCASPAYERGFGFSLEGQVTADANLARRFERRVRPWLQPALSSDLIGSTNWNVAPFWPSDDAVSAPP